MARPRHSAAEVSVTYTLRVCTTAAQDGVAALAPWPLFWPFDLMPLSALRLPRLYQGFNGLEVSGTGAFLKEACLAAFRRCVFFNCGYFLTLRVES